MAHQSSANHLFWPPFMREEYKRQSTKNTCLTTRFYSQSQEPSNHTPPSRNEGLTGGPRLISPSLFWPNALSPPTPLSFPIIQPWLPCRPPNDGRPARRPSLASHLTCLVPHLHIPSPSSPSPSPSSSYPSSNCSGPLFPFLPQFSISLDCPFFHRLFRSPTLLRTPTRPSISAFALDLTWRDLPNILPRTQPFIASESILSARSNVRTRTPSTITSGHLNSSRYHHTRSQYTNTFTPFISICNRLFQFNQIYH